ncbi:hypothetical protein PAESOLCIP111_00358 [Paenibacillus solanacearum]|uniref:Uncharacterized protein n=1 Tax=Paenibacillus solanacearum TaxID=2048548 RepID=A0A916JUI9_9BACL|nr:GNAT family N-acetyltransferase [Paenibacillus solanacearum]CAG7599997.1 hypothetical protein PAESOLCIP111_00358 [Paenibacillus solanacearum]
MEERNESELSAYALMELHAEAMFTHDADMRLRMMNEPWPGEAAAPRFFLGRTTEGRSVWRFRYDVPSEIVQRLESLCTDEPAVSDFETKPKHAEAYMELLQGERFTMGPCFHIPVETASKMPVVQLTSENIASHRLDGFEWLAAEIGYVQPCMAVVRQSHVASVCRSVRISPLAHEAGLETLEPYRGNGYAAAVVAEWAKGVRARGCVPLYSTSGDNASSQRVAQKLNLSFYGVNFTIY